MSDWIKALDENVAIPQVTVFHKKAPGTKDTAGIPIIFAVDPNFGTNDRSFEVVTLDDGKMMVRITAFAWDKVAKLKEGTITKNAGVRIKSRLGECCGMNLTEVDENDEVLAVYGIPHLWDTGKQKSLTTCGVSGKYWQASCFACDVFQQNARFRKEWNPINNPITNTEVSPLIILFIISYSITQRKGRFLLLPFDTFSNPFLTLFLLEN